MLSQLAETQRLLRELEKIDPGLAESSRAHAAAVIELSRNRALPRSLCRTPRSRSGAARALEQRVSLLETLKRKYGGSIPEVIAFGERAAERMRKIEGRDAELERLAEEIEDGADGARRGRPRRCARLRAKAAPKLAENVRQQSGGPRFPAVGIRSPAHALRRAAAQRHRCDRAAFLAESGRAAQAAALRSPRAAKSRA